MFHYYVAFWLFFQYSVVPPVFRCSTGVACSLVPCSGVPGFIVCSKIMERLLEAGFITFISFIRLCTKFNTFFAFIKLSFSKIILFGILFPIYDFCAFLIRLCLDHRLTLFRMEGAKGPPATSFSSVTSSNVGISAKTFLNFSFNPFATLA